MGTRSQFATEGGNNIPNGVLDKRILFKWFVDHVQRSTKIRILMSKLADCERWTRYNDEWRAARAIWTLKS